MDPLHGDTFNAAVRDTADELMTAVFDTSDTSEFGTRYAGCWLRAMPRSLARVLIVAGAELFVPSLLPTPLAPRRAMSLITGCRYARRSSCLPGLGTDWEYRPAGHGRVFCGASTNLQAQPC